MRSRTALWALVLAVVPLRGTAEGQPVLSIDKTVPLSQDGRIEVDEAAGPVLVGQVLLQNLPTEREVREAVRPSEFSRPRPVLVASNRGTSTANLQATVTLEDGNGEVYLRCASAGKLKKGATNELLKLWLPDQHMRTIDWPKVTVVRVVVLVQTSD